MAKKLNYTFKQHRRAIEISIERHNIRKAAWLAKQPASTETPVYPEQYVIDTLTETIEIFKNLEYVGTPDASIKAKPLTLDFA